MKIRQQFLKHGKNTENVWEKGSCKPDFVHNINFMKSSEMNRKRKNKVEFSKSLRYNQFT